MINAGELLVQAPKLLPFLEDQAREVKLTKRGSKKHLPTKRKVPDSDDEPDISDTSLESATSDAPEQPLKRKIKPPSKKKKRHSHEKDAKKDKDVRKHKSSSKHPDKHKKKKKDKKSKKERDEPQPSSSKVQETTPKKRKGSRYARLKLDLC